MVGEELYEYKPTQNVTGYKINQIFPIILFTSSIKFDSFYFRPEIHSAPLNR
jgi:hypothetical protein